MFEFPRDRGVPSNSEASWSVHLKTVQRTSQQWHQDRIIGFNSRPFGATAVGSRFAQHRPSGSQSSLRSAPRSPMQMASRGQSSFPLADTLDTGSSTSSFVVEAGSPLELSRAFGSTHSVQSCASHASTLAPSLFGAVGQPSTTSLTSRRPRTTPHLQAIAPASDFSVLNAPRGIYPARRPAVAHDLRSSSGSLSGLSRRS